GLEMVERFKTDARFKILVGATEGETFVGINNARAPFTDPRVRRAVNLALDRTAIIPYDPAAARKLLAEAGFPNGFETAFKLPPQPYARRSGEIVAALLAEV